MLQRETLIDDIRKGLAVLQYHIRPSGSLNLNDANVHAESFVAGLLNAIYGWSLISTNQETANYPCIDLIDEGNGLGVQVTSERGSGKLTQTIECLQEHGLAARIRQLKVFTLIEKQERYTVNVECSGIAFDWINDVLDFDDAVRAAQGIDDLGHLQRVRQCVVSAIPSVFPEQQSPAPPLNLPATDPEKAWLAFSSRTTPLIGRAAERAKLLEFRDSVPKFSWWLVTGAAGSGKSRLALELCRQSEPEWHAGFLSRTEKDFNWSRFRPSRKTLIVVDYVASRAGEVSDVILTLARECSSFTYPVRILLVERDTSIWWMTFSRQESQSESAEIAACQHSEPLRVPGLSPKVILELAEEVVRARTETWNPTIARDFLLRLYHYDRGGRPLFAMIVARYLEAVGSDGPNPNLLQVVLKREAGRRRSLIPDPDKLQRMENLLFLATLVSGLLPQANGFGFLVESDVSGLLPDVNLLDEALYNDIAGSAGRNASLAGLQPDVLGEQFVLDRLSEGGIAGLNARRLLLAAWGVQARDVGVVAVRSAIDFPGAPGLAKLFDLPLDSSEARIQWAEMVAELVAHSSDFEDPLVENQMLKLIPLADNHLDERRLQEAAACADYNRARSCMFRDSGIAILRFDAAIARIGKDSLIAKMAMHNRAILCRLRDENYDAFGVFTMMIETREASDENRACAFNNRADIYAERGQHDNAIRDRTEVLALNDTSPDRRFIALFRRSRSYSAIGNDQAALSDLGSILETWDITSQQKAEARLERATILRHLGQLDEARAELAIVIGSKYLFSGMRAMALVELAEVSRKSGDYSQADGLLARALNDPDVCAETCVDAMIVGALLLRDAGDLRGACKMWRTVLSSPSASDFQVRIARESLDAMSEGELGSG